MAGEGTTRQNQILKDLYDGPKTKKFLMDKYSIGLDSLNKDIAQVKEVLALQNLTLSRHGKEGYRIIPLNDNGSPVDKLPVSDSPLVAEKSRAEDFDRLVLLLLIQQHRGILDLSSDSKEVFELEYLEYKSFEEYISYDSDTARKQAAAKEFKKAFAGLVDTGLIEEAGENHFRLSKKAPIYLQLDIENAENLLELVQMFGPVHSFADTFLGLRTKLEVLLGRESIQTENIIVTGNRINKKPEIKSIIEKINDMQYDKHALKILYSDLDDNEESFDFMIGLLCYVVDKDNLYLIGRKAGDESDVILNAERIKSVSENKKIVNDIYSDKKYIDNFNEMYSISIAKAQHVVVEFENIYNIDRKLRNLLRLRRKASLWVRDNKLIYEDDIRGLADFAKFIRRYGKSAKVLEPPELVDMMRSSLEKMAERYGEIYE